MPLLEDGTWIPTVFVDPEAEHQITLSLINTDIYVSCNCKEFRDRTNPHKGDDPMARWRAHMADVDKRSGSDDTSAT